MSKTWKWSERAAVAAFLPTNLNNHITPDVARRFVAADEDVQFEVLRVLRRRSTALTTDGIGMIGVAVALYSLIITGFLQGSDRQLVALGLLFAVTVGAGLAIGAFLGLRGEQAMADEWRTAFEHALQHPPKRRWFSRAS